VSPLVTLVLPALLLVAAGFLAGRELRLYRTADPRDAELFAYSRGRLLRRLLGVVALLALAATFGALGVSPPRDAGTASTFVAAIVGEVAVLVVLSAVDLWETSRRRVDRKGATRGASRR
jgi:hypothetical protein